MKKIAGALGVFLICAMITASCGKSSAEKAVESDTSMFVEVEQAPYWVVVYHKKTKVMYAVSNGGYNHGTFTLLVDKNGNPLLYEG